MDTAGAVALGRLQLVKHRIRNIPTGKPFDIMNTSFSALKEIVHLILYQIGQICTPN